MPRLLGSHVGEFCAPLVASVAAGSPGMDRLLGSTTGISRERSIDQGAPKNETTTPGETPVAERILEPVAVMIHSGGDYECRPLT